MLSSLLSKTIVVEVSTSINPFYNGPSSVFGYIILQGIFTVLAIKEIVSVTRYFVKGSSSALRINRIILWHMVENWEDLFKICRQLLFPRRMHSFASGSYPARPALTSLAWYRFFLSGLIALWLFGADISLIVASVPSGVDQDASRVSRLSWANSAPIPTLTKNNTIHGSFSRVVQLKSATNDVEFTILPSVSLERTDFRDFGLPPPRFNGTLMECNSTEVWRIVCRIHCERRFYQYKLRLDVSTDSGDFFFVPTTDISVIRGINKLDTYIKAIETQLRINVTGKKSRPNYFSIQTASLPPEETVVANKDKVLTHDAIATLFLGTVEIKSSNMSAKYYKRKSGTRKEFTSEVRGTIAVSQRPLLPLFGTIVIYVVAQLISIVQQKGFRLHNSSAEMSALLEVAGGPCVDNIANVSVEPRSLVNSRTTAVHNNERQEFGHIGFLPGSIVLHVHEFLRTRNNDIGLELFGIVEEDQLKGGISMEVP